MLSTPNILCLLMRWRGRMMSAGSAGKKALGMLVIVVGLLIISGGAHLIEGCEVNTLPDWLTDLTTSI
jgi:cytochrome c-type biogenesis protein